MYKQHKFSVSKETSFLDDPSNTYITYIQYIVIISFKNLSLSITVDRLWEMEKSLVKESRAKLRTYLDNCKHVWSKNCLCFFCSRALRLHFTSNIVSRWHFFARFVLQRLRECLRDPPFNDISNSLKYLVEFSLSSMRPISLLHLNLWHKNRGDND